ncbi:MAG: AMP-binding enzyme, partial [Paracoccus sp. (in: a-proteobacteria)]
DQARMDPDGAITMLGRADDIMNAGGFRVAPPEIEEVLVAHHGAGDLAAAELSVGPGTSIIAAFWTGPATEAELCAMAETALARYKQPRAYIHLDALPRTPTGKINRRALRDTHSKDRA